MKYQISHIFEGIELSDEQKQKIDESFNAAIEAKESELSELNESVKQELIQELEAKNQEFLKEKAYDYYTEVAKTATQEFVTEKSKELEASSKIMIQESVLKDMKAIFEKHGFQTPEYVSDKEKLAEANKRIDNLIAESVEKDKEIEQARKLYLIESLAKDLTESQKDKLEEAMTDVVFVSEDQFKEACKKLIESIVVTKEEPKVQTQTVMTEGVQKPIVTFQF